jgi:hypothetical protein
MRTSGSRRRVSLCGRGIASAQGGWLEGCCFIQCIHWDTKLSARLRKKGWHKLPEGNKLPLCYLNTALLVGVSAAQMFHHLSRDSLGGVVAQEWPLWL